MDRWLNADGCYDNGNGIFRHNMFAYCDNNPVMRIDPNGESARGIVWKLALLGFVLGVVAALSYVQPNIQPYASYGEGRGDVYIVTEDKVEEVEKIKDDKDVVIVDYRNDPDPNMQVKESFKIKKKKYRTEIAQIMLDYNAENPVDPAWNRTVDSIVKNGNFIMLHIFGDIKGKEQQILILIMLMKEKDYGILLLEVRDENKDFFALDFVNFRWNYNTKPDFVLFFSWKCIPIINVSILKLAFVGIIEKRYIYVLISLLLCFLIIFGSISIKRGNIVLPIFVMAIYLLDFGQVIFLFVIALKEDYINSFVLLSGIIDIIVLTMFTMYFTERFKAMRQKQKVTVK